MTAQVIRVKANVAYCDLCLMGVNSRIGLGDTVTLEHIKQGGLACVVQTQEHDVRILLEEA